MTRTWTILLLSLVFQPLIAQNTNCGGSTPFRILHFTKTNGFDHNTRAQSAQMFEDIGTLHNFTVTNTENTDLFDELDSLLQFEIIIWSNTSGNNVLNSTQQTNMEAYIEAGGSFMGIHAATDTYRNRSWPFYNSLVGGIVQSGPNHTSQNFFGTMDVIGSHPSTENLPNPWEKEEEYYYWELNGGQLDPDIVETLRVRSTGDNSYDAARPISWYKEFPSGARSYYTALGHKRNNYTDPDNDFRKLIQDALCWCVESVITSTNESTGLSRIPTLLQNPVQNQIALKNPTGKELVVRLVASNGDLVGQYELMHSLQQLDVSDLPSGIYFIQFIGTQYPVLRFSKIK